MVLKADGSLLMADGKGEKADGSWLMADGKGESGQQVTLRKLNKHIRRLVRLAEACDGEGIREELRKVVPEYHQQG